MRRREFIARLGGAAAAWPFAAMAQQAERMRQISVLMSLADSDPQAQAQLAALARGLRDLGWAEGRNYRIEFHGIAGGGIDRVRAAVAEVVASNPDVVHANNTPIVQELQRQTRTIPIVFANVGDPVATGVVASLAYPGGNATGFGRIGVVWERSGLAVSASGRLCRSHPQGRESGRPTGAGANQLRNGPQSQDREGARPHHPRNAAGHRRRGHPMIRWWEFIARPAAGRLRLRSAGCQNPYVHEKPLLR
jgi:ABC transporter substrate binding protein